MPIYSPPTKRINRQLLLKKRYNRALSSNLTEVDFKPPQFEKPLFIVSSPRAGSTLLFETMSHFPDLWFNFEESHELIEGIPELHPSARGYNSNRLTASDASSDIISALKEKFALNLQNRDGKSYMDIPKEMRPATIRFLEKTPKNSLRIPFLNAVFPGAHFIWLWRDPRENISSLMEGWNSDRFISYRNIPGCCRKAWSFLLPSGWLNVQESSIAEISAYQWKMANLSIMEDIRSIAPSCWCMIQYKDLLGNPEKTIRKIAAFAGLTMDEAIQKRVSGHLPISRLTLSDPAPDKWRKNEAEIMKVMPSLEPLVNIMDCYHNKKHKENQ